VVGGIALTNKQILQQGCEVTCRIVSKSWGSSWLSRASKYFIRQTIYEHGLDPHKGYTLSKTVRGFSLTPNRRRLEVFRLGKTASGTYGLLRKALSEDEGKLKLCYKNQSVNAV